MDRRTFPITVVIPTHNRIELLINCLEHLEKQTLKDFEVVVVDDGSTDNTAELMQSYILRSPLVVRFLRQQNRGPASARNQAISVIDSPICLMIGDDILASPTLLEEHIRLHRRLPQISVVALGLTRWSQEGQEVTPLMQWLDDCGMQFDYGPLLQGEPSDWRHFYTSNLSLKTEVLKQLPFDESYPHAAMEDLDLACRIEAKIGLELIFLPSAVAHHVHPTSFAQACRRMIKVGESTDHFDQVWPGKRPALERPQNATLLKRVLKHAMSANLWALPAAARLAEWSLAWKCPNPFMRYVLGCYFRMGYDRHARLRHTQQEKQLNKQRRARNGQTDSQVS